MSTLLDFIRSSLNQLHSSYKDAIADLSDEQINWWAK